MLDIGDRASSFSTVLPIMVLDKGLLPRSFVSRFWIPWILVLWFAVFRWGLAVFLEDSFCLRSVFLAMAANLSLASTIFILFLASSLFLASTTTGWPPFWFFSFPLMTLTPCFPATCFVTFPEFLATFNRGLLLFFLVFRPTPAFFTPPTAFPLPTLALRLETIKITWHLVNGDFLKNGIYWIILLIFASVKVKLFGILLNKLIKTFIHFIGN